LTAPTATAAGLQLHWDDAFSAQEQRKLTMWVTETAAALASLVGDFPFAVHVHFHRRDGAREPVPWANTRRGGRQSIHFHVDPRFPLEAFRHDWTAAHEFAHLVLPYLGSRHAWFAEGFASYLQYPVMQAMGVLSAAEAARRYERNIERARRGYSHGDRPFATAAPRLRAEAKYPTLYWGGAVYFLAADRALQDRTGTGLVPLLRDYLACCRDGRGSSASLAADLDRLSGTDVFSTLLSRFEDQPGFPDWPP
jgi:hypothetical protein